MSVTISNPSITHTFGNVACVAIDYVQSFFPENFFTKTHISTKLAHRQLDVFKAKTGFWKNKKPMLVLRPRIEYDDSSKWFYGSTMTNRVTHGNVPMEYANLVPMCVDKDNGCGIHFLWNRYKIIYDVVIVVDTYNKQVNIMNDLKNKLNIEAPYMIKTNLEAYLPKTTINTIMNYVDIDKSNTPEVLNYLNTYSIVPITYKLHNGSGQNEYFMMYPTNIETFCTDLTADDGEQRGMIADTYTVAFSMSMEFYGVSAWYAFIGNDDNSFINAPYDDDNSDRIVPISSIPLDYNLELEKGWKVLASPFYFPDEGVSVDETDISSILEMASVKAVIGHHKKYNIPLDPFIRFRCFKGREEIPVGIFGFDIDYNKKCIYTYRPSGKMSYRLFVLINAVAINNMASEINNFNFEK